MASPKKAILITGATGKQGGAVIDSLLSAEEAKDFTIVAVTRNPESGSAKKLQARGVAVIQGDLNDVPTIFSNAKQAIGHDVWGVFSVQVAIGKGASSAIEEVQGKALVDAAVANHVEFFVYSSVERGGEAKSWENPTDVPHFISKHHVEQHLVEKSKGKMSWVIIRPVAFMENFEPGFGTKIMATAWKLTLKEDKPLQLVSIKDIGHFAAQAFLHPKEFAGRSISLAGDDISLREANEVFKAQAGSFMPETFHFVARLILWFVPEFGNMWRWFDTEGFGADVTALKKEHPGLLSFKDWLENDSAWARKSA